MSTFIAFLRSTFKVMPGLFLIMLGVVVFRLEAGRTAFATAVVIACPCTYFAPKGCQPTLQFETPQKQTITILFWGGSYTVGETVHIRYDPHNPSSAGSADNFLYNGVFVSLGFIGLGVLSIIVEIMKKEIPPPFTLSGKRTHREPHPPDAEDPPGRRRIAHHHPHHHPHRYD